MESTEISPHIDGQLIYDKGGKKIQWRKAASSIYGAGKILQIHEKEWNWTSSLHNTQK